VRALALQILALARAKPVFAAVANLLLYPPCSESGILERSEDKSYRLAWEKYEIFSFFNAQIYKRYSRMERL